MPVSRTGGAVSVFFFANPPNWAGLLMNELTRSCCIVGRFHTEGALPRNRKKNVSFQAAIRSCHERSLERHAPPGVRRWPRTCLVQRSGFRRPKAGAIRQEAMDQHQINPAAILATPAEALLDSALSTGTPSFAERILVQAWFCAPPPAVKTRDNVGAPSC